jgi:alpha-tubulin suppressor-like RCC1 family protein
MSSPGGQFLSDEFGDIEDYFITDYQLIDQYIGDQLWSWGRNAYGQQGVNNTTQRNTPVTTLLGGTNWKQVSSSGQSSVYAIKTDGTLWNWGNNPFGQLGVNDTTQRNTPVTTLLGGTNWKSVTAGTGHVAAIKTDGTLWLWGSNSYGQLGVNQSQFATSRSTPVTTLLGGNNWKQVSAKGDSTAAIKTDGTLWLWGKNDQGQLGVNDNTTRSTPVTTLLGGNNWKQVSCGTAAIKTDGTLWLWGSNSGALGTNDGTQRNTPVTTLLGGTNWKQVDTGVLYTAAIKTDGTLWVWGRNLNGQLGINESGLVTNRNTPVTTLLGGTNWKQVSCGTGSGERTAALKTDGTLWTWGSNPFGELGVNDTTARSTPVTTLLGGNNWKQVSTNQACTIAVTAGTSVDFS